MSPPLNACKTLVFCGLAGLLLSTAAAQTLTTQGMEIAVSGPLPGDQVLPAARAMAQEMSEVDPIVLAYAKRALQYGAAHTMAEAMKNEQSESPRLKAARAAANAAKTAAA